MSIVTQFENRMLLSSDIADTARTDLDQFIFNGLTKILESGYTGNHKLSTHLLIGVSHYEYLLLEGKLIERRTSRGGTYSFSAQREASNNERDIEPNEVYLGSNSNNPDEQRISVAKTVEGILMSLKSTIDQARFDINCENNFDVIEPTRQYL